MTLSDRDIVIDLRRTVLREHINHCVRINSQKIKRNQSKRRGRVQNNNAKPVRTIDTVADVRRRRRDRRDSTRSGQRLLRCVHVLKGSFNRCNARRLLMRTARRGNIRAGEVEMGFI